MNYSNIISTYGFPIFTTIGISGIIFYIWRWITIEMVPLLGETNKHVKELNNEIEDLMDTIKTLKDKIEMIIELRDR